jgi:hypothetical protein
VKPCKNSKDMNTMSNMPYNHPNVWSSKNEWGGTSFIKQIRAIHYITLLQKVHSGLWFKKQKPEEEVVEHAAAMT